MNREKSLVKNTIIIGFGTFLPKFASLITLPIVTGDLTKAEYGTYDLLLILVSLVLPLATLQIQCAAFRFLVQIREDEEKCSNVISNIIWFTLGMSVLPLIVIFFMLGKYGVWTRVVICLYFLFDIILQTLQQVVRGLGKNGMYSVSTVLNSLLNMLMIVVLVRVFNMGLVGVVGSMVVANSITSAYLMLKSGIIRYISISRLSWYMIKEMIAYSWPLIPNNLSSWIMTLSDRLILAFFWGVEANAVYAVTKKIPNLLTTVQNPFSLAWHENASLSAEDSDINEYYSSMFDKVFNIVFGACAVLIGISPILFSLLIRGEYAEAYSQMPVLFLATTFLSLSSYLAGIYIADKRTKEIGTTTTIAAIINLIIDLIAIPFIGTWAASISTLVSYVFLFVYRLIDLKKFHNIHYKYVKLGFGIFMLVLLSFLSSFNQRWLNWGVLVVGLIVAVVFNRGFIKGIIKKITK